MESILFMLLYLLIIFIPVIFIGLTIYFMLSNNPKLKLIGKIMLGIIILIAAIPVIFFLGCTGFLLFSIGH